MANIVGDRLLPISVNQAQAAISSPLPKKSDLLRLQQDLRSASAYYTLLAGLGSELA